MKSPVKSIKEAMLRECGMRRANAGRHSD